MSATPVTVTAPSPVLFGTGDGSTSAFPLVPRASLFNGAIDIYRNDWQGNQKLYPTPRTNRLKYSQQFDNAVWGKGNCTITPNATLAPDGTMTADAIVRTATGNHYILQNLASTTAAGKPFIAFVEMKSGTYTGMVRVWLKDGAGVSLAINNVQLTSNWQLFAVSGTYPANATGAPGLYIDPSDDVGVAGEYFYVFGADVKDGLVPSGYIPTLDTPVTITDYSIDDAANVILAEVPASGAALTWQGAFAYVPVPEAVSFARSTIISQYANSPTLAQLIENMGQYVDPTANFDAFYKLVWNVNTAQGFGLDIWGRIVDVSRQLNVVDAPTYFGFQDGLTDYAPFGSAPFYSGNPASTSVYTLTDDAYRVLILVKALANISATTAPALNQLLRNLFPNRGRCYVNDMGGMQMRYTFEFYLQPFEYAILTQSGVLPRPAGVSVTVLQISLPYVFGFSEAGTDSATPFGQGTFY